MAHPDTPNRFVMIGVIHRDARLGTLLSRWLESLGPDVVTLEFSLHGLAFRRCYGEDLARRVRGTVDELRSEGHRIDSKALDALLAYIALPSEFTVASGFAERRAIPLHLVDMDSHSRSYLSAMEELVARDNLVKLFGGSSGGTEGVEMAAARLFFEKNVSLFPYTEEMRARDSHMRDRIGKLMESHPHGRFLHICGWRHLCDPCGLYAPLNPQKVFLHDKAFRV